VPLIAGRALGGHDIVVYLINAQQMAENLRSGELFPAWGGGFNAGFGAPTLLFFPPLTSYLHALPILLGVPVIIGVSALSLTSLFLSGVVLFGWLRSAGFGCGALPAALVYMVAPYRLIDLYFRSALAEHWAFVWPPLLLWVATTPRLSWPTRTAMVATSVTLLLVSNIPSATFFGIALAVWFSMARVLRGRRLSIAVGVILGFAGAAFALLPQSLSGSLLAVDQYYGHEAGRFRASANGLFAGGFSAGEFNTTVSASVVTVFALSVLAFLSLEPRERRRPWMWGALTCSCLCLLAATTPLGPVWDAVPLLSKFQFPWRVASLMTLAAGVLIAGLRGRRRWLMCGLAAAAAVPFLGWDRTVPMETFSSPRPDRPAAGTVFPDPWTAWEAGSGGWYWRHHNLAEIWFLAANVKPDFLDELAGGRVHRFDEIRDRPAVVRSDASADVSVVEWGSTRRQIELEASQPATLMWRAIAFPGMEVKIDGRAVSASADPSTGLLVHPIPAGRHRVELRWVAFRYLEWARMISSAAFAVLAALVIVGARRSWRDAQRGNQGRGR
jgi:hypothetical protein